MRGRVYSTHEQKKHGIAHDDFYSHYQFLVGFQTVFGLFAPSHVFERSAKNMIYSIIFLTCPPISPHASLLMASLVRLIVHSVTPVAGSPCTWQRGCNCWVRAGDVPTAYAPPHPQNIGPELNAIDWGRNWGHKKGARPIVWTSCGQWASGSTTGNTPAQAEMVTTVLDIVWIKSCEDIQIDPNPPHLLAEMILKPWRRT